MRHMTTQYNHFTKNERNELSILLKKGYSQRSIAAVLRKSPPSIGREIKRNTVNSEYDPLKADHKAYVKRKYSKYQFMKIARNPDLEKYIIKKLEAGWSPQAIVERLKVEHHGKPVISFKLIYQWLRTVHGERYRKHLVAKRSGWIRRTKGVTSMTIKNRIFIEERPSVINGRTRIGDFECDVLGSSKSEPERVAGVVERRSRYLDLEKVSRLRESMTGYQRMLQLHGALSGTFDNGTENTYHQSLGIPTYFCHAYSAWEKGTMENTFQRLRRFIPKRSKLSEYSSDDISAIAEAMNDIPRKCLGWKTPREVFFNLSLELTFI